MNYIEVHIDVAITGVGMITMVEAIITLEVLPQLMWLLGTLGGLSNTLPTTGLTPAAWKLPQENPALQGELPRLGVTLAGERPTSRPGMRLVAPSVAETRIWQPPTLLLSLYACQDAIAAAVP